MTCPHNALADALMHAIGGLGKVGVYQVTGKTVDAFYKQANPNIPKVGINANDLCALAGACEARGIEHRILTVVRQEIGRQRNLHADEAVADEQLLSGVLTGVKQAAALAETYELSVDENGPGGKSITDAERDELLEAAGKLIQDGQNIERDLLASRSGPVEVKDAAS